MTQMTEHAPVSVKEEVVLQKFEGDNTLPENEVERLVVVDGKVVAHNKIENGEVVGEVEEGSLLGKDIGLLTQ